MIKFDFENKSVYKSAIREENEYFKNESSKHDKELMKLMLKEIRGLGYSYYYFSDITHCENNDQKLFNLLMNYLGKFDDEYFNSCIISKIAVKENNINILKDLCVYYSTLSQDKKKLNANYYDNAFKRLLKKKDIPLILATIHSFFDKFPLTLRRLAKFQVPEIKNIFYECLTNNLKCLEQTKMKDQFIYTSIICLSYYDDYDNSIVMLLNKYLEAKDKNLVMSAKKAIQNVLQKKQKD